MKFFSQKVLKIKLQKNGSLKIANRYVSAAQYFSTLYILENERQVAMEAMKSVLSKSLTSLRLKIFYLPTSSVY